MPRGIPHNDETKARAIAALLAGDSPAAVARRLSVPENTVRSWGERASVSFVEVRGNKQVHLQEMIAAYLCENLTTLMTQCRVAADPCYLYEQDGEKLAKLHGSMADIAIRMLEAAAAAAPLDGLEPEVLEAEQS